MLRSYVTFNKLFDLCACLPVCEIMLIKAITGWLSGLSKCLDKCHLEKRHLENTQLFLVSLHTLYSLPKH